MVQQRRSPGRYCEPVIKENVNNTDCNRIPPPALIQSSHTATVRSELTVMDFSLHFWCDLCSMCSTPCLKKNCANLFFIRTLPNFDLYCTYIVKIFGKKIAERTGFSEVYSFSTSPNLCQRTTVLNADVQNCYITL